MNEQLAKTPVAPLHIAFVDDDPDEHHMFLASLEELDIEVKLSVFYDCSGLMDFLTSNGHKPDLIFLDLKMPRQDGKHCLQKLKDNEDSNQIPIIVYSGSRLVEDVEFCKQQGAVTYLVKPNTFQKLTEELHLILTASGLKSSRY